MSEKKPQTLLSAKVEPAPPPPAQNPREQDQNIPVGQRPLSPLGREMLKRLNENALAGVPTP